MSKAGRGLTGIDRVIPNFPGPDEALEPAPAAAARPPPDPGASTSPA
jgi:hypothetical protein